MHLWFTLGVSALQEPFYITLQSIIGRSCHEYNFCRNKHVFVTTKYVFCRDKSMLATTTKLSQQNYVCHEKIFLLRQNFCHDKYLSQKTYVCHDKHMFVMTKDVFCRVKHVVVMTKVSLLGQNYVCHDKYLSCLICHDRHDFVKTKDMFMTKVLSWQKWYLRQLPPVLTISCATYATNAWPRQEPSAQPQLTGVRA